MRQFGTAKAVFGFFITVGWIIAALSVILFIYILFKLGFETIVALSCCLLFVSGIFTVAAGQMGLAQIATAENTAAILAALTQNNQKNRPAASSISQKEQEKWFFAQREASAPIRNNLAKTQTEVLKFKGYEIIRNQHGFSVYGMMFENITDAEEWITERVATTILNESEDNKDGS